VIACLVADPALVTVEMMEAWALDLDGWGICDCAAYLFDRTRFAWPKAMEWSRRDEEFVKRAAYSIMAALAIHDKAAPDAKFLRFLPAIRRGATDERHFVKKGVNWALRQIGKRNLALNRAAIAEAREIARMNSPSARWIASDALRELEGAAVQRRLRRCTADLQAGGRRPRRPGGTEH
jgi:3-methyladenine DNA glycosylase AlkD